MAIVCPTVLASDAHDYQTQLNRVAHFASRIQVDLTDGEFAKSSTILLEQAWWPPHVKVDLHLMYKNPEPYIKECIRLKPHMVIVHAEADGQFFKIASELHKANIQTGVAILPKTSTHVVKPSLKYIDHILIFSGDLGKFGGIADLQLLKKVKQLKEWKSDLEIGWDGGVNNENAKVLAEGGVDVLNVGGYIQKAVDPKANFLHLEQLLSESMI